MRVVLHFVPTKHKEKNQRYITGTYDSAFYIFIAMIRYRYISRHPVLLNYTPILHETVFRMTLIQMWTTRWSKDTGFFFSTRDKTWMFYNSTLYFPQKCAMRSSSIESNTTIYNRPILCESQEQLGELSFLFFLFSEMVMANIQSTATGNSGHRDALCPFGKEEKN